MMFRRLLSPRYTVVALAVALSLLLGDHRTTAQTSPSPAGSPTTSGATPGPTTAGRGATPSPTGTSASDEMTSGTDDSEPGESFLDCSTDNSGDGYCDDDNNSEICDAPVDAEEAEDTETNEDNAASGLFNRASFATIITATVAAVGLALC
eukprot:jgi/Undpi1/12854/HiC_scaffold_7.g02521.m1